MPCPARHRHAGPDQPCIPSRSLGCPPLYTPHCGPGRGIDGRTAAGDAQDRQQRHRAHWRARAAAAVGRRVGARARWWRWRRGHGACCCALALLRGRAAQWSGPVPAPPSLTLGHPHHPPRPTRPPGNTPMVYLKRIGAGAGARIAVKLETQEPCRSVKDRIGRGMIEDAERKGLISPGKTTLVEPTSGELRCGLERGLDGGTRGCGSIGWAPEVVPSRSHARLPTPGPHPPPCSLLHHPQATRASGWRSLRRPRDTSSC